MELKEKLLEELSQSAQRAGTLTVLHTNAVASRIGLSATEFEAMDIITHHQPITAGHLAACCGLTTGAITGIIDRLERGSFVNRQRDPEDRRRVFIEPNEDPEKSKTVRELYRPIAEGFRQVAQRYTPEQLRLLIDMQNAASDMVEKAIIELREK